MIATGILQFSSVPTNSNSDFVVDNHGSIFLLAPQTEAQTKS